MGPYAPQLEPHVPQLGPYVPLLGPYVPQLEPHVPQRVLWTKLMQAYGQVRSASSC